MDPALHDLTFFCADMPALPLSFVLSTVQRGVNLCAPRTTLAGTPCRVMFICGHGGQCVVLGLCCSDAVRFQLKFW